MEGRVVLRNALVFAGALALVVFLVLLVNQTAQLVALADRFSPTLGKIVLWALVAFYVLCVVVPVVWFARLPRRIAPPASEESPEFAAYLDQLRARLARNPLVAGRPVSDRSEIETALAVLDEAADEVTRRTAAQIFLATAVSQNGSLDTLVVLGAQSRLVLQIARIYNQRPSPRDLVWLYTNVAGTALIAGSLEEIDISEQLQPVLSGAVGSAVGAVPGFQAVSTVIVNSLLSGSANAFLTLRVGIIARRYCGSLVRPERGVLRKSAAAQAAMMLTGIVSSGARQITAAAFTASTRGVTGALKGVNTKLRDSVAAVAEKVRGRKTLDAPVASPDLQGEGG